MTPSQAFVQSLLRPVKQQASEGLALGVVWTVNEIEHGILVPKVKRKNLFTNYGLTALASAIGGGYVPPSYLAISTTYSTIYAQINPGATSIQLNGDPTLVGDTQLVLSPGTINQETVTFTTKSGAGPYTFALTTPYPANTHPVSDPVVRQVLVGDAMAQLTNEAQFDPTYYPNQRAFRTAGFSAGSGQYTMQFYFSGTTLTNIYCMTLGLTDQATIGSVSANLHNEVVLGYNHNNTNDVEIDINFTLINN